MKHTICHTTQSMHSTAMGYILHGRLTTLLYVGTYICMQVPENTLGSKQIWNFTIQRKSKQMFEKFGDYI